MEYVGNASPLSAFERLERLDLLQNLTGRLLIPGAVRLEVFGLRGLPSWITERPIAQPLSQQILASRLGLGESEAIALALEVSRCTLILDDLAARRTAQSLKIRVVGTVGLLVQARQRNLVPVLRPFLDDLGSLDFHVSDRLIKFALGQVGE